MRNLTFLILLLIATNCFAQFSGKGSGTEKDPYQITNAYELFEIRNDLKGHYVLMNDINLREWLLEENPTQGWAPIGTESSPFEGVVDGNNKAITGLYINRPNLTGVGLFGWISGNSTIQNLALINPDITGKTNVGAICGVYLENGSFNMRISNCKVSKGNVIGDDNAAGIIGLINSGTLAYQGTIELSANDCSSSIFCATTNTGGICAYINAYCDDIMIKDNQFSGTIFASSSSIGGILGKISFYSGITPGECGLIHNNIFSGKIYANNSKWVSGIINGYYTRMDYTGVCKNNVVIADTISFQTVTDFAKIGQMNDNTVSPRYTLKYSDNICSASINILKDNKPIFIDDDNEFNGISYGQNSLKRRSTYEGLGFDFNTQWSIIESKTFPFNINMTPPPTVDKFLSGSKGTIEGSAPISSGKAYIFYKGNMIETNVVDGKWSSYLGYVQKDDVVSVFIKAENKLPSIEISAIAADSGAVEPQDLLGDANGDGSVDVSDVVSLINHIVGKSSSSFNIKNADINKDGQILIDDAVNLVNIILNLQK